MDDNTDDKRFDHVHPQTGKLLKECYKHMAVGDINVDAMMEEYAKQFPKTAALRLLQDLQDQRLVFENMYEEIKRLSFDEIFGASNARTAKNVLMKYKSLGLIPEKAEGLPNTELYELIAWATDRAAKAATATLRILSRYMPDILASLQLSAGVNVTLQAGISMKASVTVGLETSLTAQHR